MMRRFDGRLVLALTLGAALSTMFGCERDASGLTEWTPADHDHQAEPRSSRHNMVTRQQKNNPHAPPSQRNQLIDVTWSKQCATCHGRRGKGDGPTSTMVKARDLTNVEFQATLTDEQIAKVIREGKDKMPAFNLPDSIIEGLVQHVRGFVKKQRPGRDEDDAVEPGAADDSPEPEPAAPNAPASAGSVPAPSAPAPPAGAADTTPHAPTQTPPAGGAPTAAPPGGKPPATPAHGSPVPSSPVPSSPAPAPSAPHP